MLKQSAEGGLHFQPKIAKAAIKFSKQSASVNFAVLH